MERVYIINHNDKEILVLNYSELKEGGMIAVLDSSIEFALKRNKKTLALSILKDNYITPTFMRHFEKQIVRIDHLADRNAIVGLSQIQLWILKAVNLWYKKQIHHFSTIDEALDFLTLG